MKKIGRILIPVIFVLACIVPICIKNTYYITVLNSAMITSIMVIGLNFVTGLSGQMNLGTAGIMALGAYTAGMVSTKFSFTPILGMLCALAMGFIIGKVLGYPSLRVSGVYLAITTIGFTEVVRIIINNATSLTGGAGGLKEIPKIKLFGFIFDTPHKLFYFILAMVVIVTFIAWRVVNSKWGRSMKAVRDNTEAAKAGGMDIAKIKILSFTMAAILGCLGGALYAYQMGYINPSTFTQAYSTNFVVMLIIGGSGSVAGSLIGGMVMTILPEVARFLENYYWLVASIITLLFIIFLPNGVISLFVKTNSCGRLRIFKGGIKRVHHTKD